MKLDMLLVVESVLETKRAQNDPRRVAWEHVADAWTLLVIERELASDVMCIGSAIEDLEDAFRDEWLDQGGKVTGSRIDVRALGLVATREGVEGALTNYPHLDRDEVVRALEAVKPFLAEDAKSNAKPEAKP